MEITPQTVLKHISGLTGTFVKGYNPTGKPYKIQRKLEDGRVYFAPIGEFKIIKR